ncbi:MAG: hypothetical protein JW940_31190 [Polyangiaceae bacterium]|nr:hypothetical protein [Polyangiaceae bacterium]
MQLCRRYPVDRLVYLAADDMMDRVVEALAKRTVGEAVSDRALWSRAVERCGGASPEAIRSFVALELERQKIREIETLAAPGAVAVELLAGRIVLMTDVLRSLRPDDVYSSAIVAYGSLEQPVIAQRAERWFVSPGPVRASAGMLLFEDDGGVELTLLDASSKPMHTRRLMDATEARLRVSGEASG